MNIGNTIFYWINLDNRQDKRQHMMKQFVGFPNVKLLSLNKY